MKYLCKVWKCWLPVFYPFEANLRAAKTTVSKKMCAGFNLQLSTLNPVSPCVLSARWSIEIFMRLVFHRDIQDRFLRETFCKKLKSVPPLWDIHAFKSSTPLFSFGISASSPTPYILPIPWRPWVPIDRTISLKWLWKKTVDSSDHQVSLCRFAAQCRYGSMKTHHCTPFLRNWGGGKGPLRLKTSTCSSALLLSDWTGPTAHTQRATALVLAWVWNTSAWPVDRDLHSNRLDLAWRLRMWFACNSAGAGSRGRDTSCKTRTHCSWSGFAYGLRQEAAIMRAEPGPPFTHTARLARHYLTGLRW